MARGRGTRSPTPGRHTPWPTARSHVRQPLSRAPGRRRQLALPRSLAAAGSGRVAASPARCAPSPRAVRAGRRGRGGAASTAGTASAERTARALSRDANQCEHRGGAARSTGAERQRCRREHRRGATGPHTRERTTPATPNEREAREGSTMRREENVSVSSAPVRPRRPTQ